MYQNQPDPKVVAAEKAKKELVFKTRPFEETVVDTVKWLQSEGKIQ